MEVFIDRWESPNTATLVETSCEMMNYLNCKYKNVIILNAIIINTIWASPEKSYYYYYIIN